MGLGLILCILVSIKEQYLHLSGRQLWVFSMTPVCRYPCLLFVPVCVCMTEAVTIKNPVPAELCILFLPINGNFSICRDVWAYLWVSEWRT